MRQIMLFIITCLQYLTVNAQHITSLPELLSETLTESEFIYGRMRGRFGTPPTDSKTNKNRAGRLSSEFANPRLWPDAVVPYQVENTIDHREWLTLQRIFSNISSVTNIQFLPRRARDTDYLLITENIKEYGCGCCSIGVGYRKGEGAHVLVLGPVSEGGCGVNHIGGTHEMLHILGLAHVQNRPDRCNYIDVETEGLVGWGEWDVGQITQAADWFQLRIPYDCSSYVHYYQLQGAVWTKDIMGKVDVFMEEQGCEQFQRGTFVNKCLVAGGYIQKGRIIKNGYDRCLSNWDTKHKRCVDSVIKRYPTFRLVDPNGRCRQNGVNKSKRQSHQLSQWDIWALNAAYGGPLPICQAPGRVGDGVCDAGNNNIGCAYDGGDCCLPQASSSSCIDPCGVRLKFYNGTNRECSKAPSSDSFCSDHYWYGPNKCSAQYCRAVEEKYLQWQCKKTCGLCNIPPSRKEMDNICNAFVSPELRQKYTQVQKQKISLKPNGRIAPTKQDEVFSSSTKQNRVKASSTKQNRVKASSIKQNGIETGSPKQNRNKASSPKQNRVKDSSPKQNRGTQTKRKQITQRKTKKGGFTVIRSHERRQQMRSYWARTG